MTSLISLIDNLLPQTQCGKCGYDGCLPYAKAISAGEAINKCPPGGTQTVKKLARLLDTEYLPLQKPAELPQIAYIREDECIGCTKCLAVCPTDAIIGAGKFLHVVLSDVCSGCELCLAPCPVDCIDLIKIKNPDTLENRANLFRSRYKNRQLRLNRIKNKISNTNKIPIKVNLSTTIKQHNNQQNKLKKQLIQLQNNLNKTYKQQLIHNNSNLENQIAILQKAINQLKNELGSVD